METNQDLRNANRRLLDQLKKSQEEISKLIVASKHSDPRLLSSIPLTSTVVNHNQDDTLKKSGRLIQEARRTITKSPGILKRKSASHKVKNRLPSPLKSPINYETPAKYKIISKFLQKQSGDGKNLTFCQSPDNEPLLTDVGNRRPLRINDSSSKPKSVLVHTSNNQTFPGQVTFQTPIKIYDSDNNIDNRKTPPLLGYDWIAGVIDNAEPSPKFSNSFLEEMKEYRKANRSECHSKRHWNEILQTPKTPAENFQPCRQVKTKERSPDPSDTRDSRIINYTINKRLFPVPVDPDESVEPGTHSSPRYIRVSIPKSSLISPYRYQPLRRSDASIRPDSLALPDNCVAGWQNRVPRRNDLPHKHGNNLDLLSSLRPQDSLARLQLKSGQATIPFQNKMDETTLLSDSYSVQYNLMKFRERK